MGLDSYFIYKDLEDEKFMFADDLAWPDVNLCGGMFSGHGDGSFRGKVYNDFIERITGETLYVDDLDIELVAVRLEEFVSKHKEELNPDDDVSEEDEYEVSFGEVVDLAKMFRFAADNNLGYHAWY